MSKHRKRKTLHHGIPAETINWNNVAWEVVLAHAPKQSSLQTAESLHPNAATMDRYVFGRGEKRESARAIIDSYAFRFPVTVVRAV